MYSPVLGLLYWKIEVRELAVVLLCGLIVGACRFFFRLKYAKINTSIFDFYLAKPFADVLGERHPPKTTLVSSTFSAIPRVLSGSALTQIISTIVQRVVIPVIGQPSRDYHVHAWATVRPLSIKTFRMGIPLSNPVPLRQPLEVGGVHDGVLILRKWNQAVRFIKRLGHRVSMHAVAFFEHRPTPNRMVQFSRYSILFLMFSPSVFAQSTTVSGTISDASGQAWKLGTFSFVFKPSPSNPTGTYYWNGSVFSKTQTFQGDLDSSGHFSVSLPSNTSITPSGSTWVPTFCSIARGNSPCYTPQSGLTITGATQDLSGAIIPPAISIDLTHVAFPFVTAYKPQEITTATFAGLFWNYTLSHYFYCAAVAPAGVDQTYGPCTSWIELCQAGDSTCGGTGSNASYQHNGTLVGTQPTLNVIDTGTVVATLTNDTLNNRVNLSLAASSGTGCTVGALLDQWVMSIHPDHTCYGSTHWTWDDTTGRQNVQAGLSNTLTNDVLTSAFGNNLSITNISGGNSGGAFAVGGHANIAADNTSFLGDVFLMGDPGSGAVLTVNSAGGSTVVNTMCLLWACEDIGSGTAYRGIKASGASGVNMVFTVGRYVGVSSTGGNTSSIFVLGESSTFSSANGCNNSDNFELGEFDSVTCSGASTADVDDTVVLGQNHSISSTTHNLGFAYILGNGNSISQSSGANIGNDGLFGKALTATNVSDCWLVGENGNCPSSNFVGVGLSSTPEIGITSGTVNVTGALDLNGVRLAAILGTPTVCNLGSPITSIGAGTTQVVIACSTTAPSTGCPCRAFVSWNIEGNGTSGTEQAEGIISDGTSSFAGTSSTMDNQITTGYKGMNRSDYSPNLYTNSQSVTFTLRAASDHTWNIQTASFYLSAPTQVRVTYFTSN